MTDVDRDPDPLDPFHHSGQLLGPLAEELPDRDHVLQAGENRVILCNTADLLECGLLLPPGLLGDEFADRRQVTGMDGHPVREPGCRLDTGADLPDRLAPDRIIQSGKVQVAVRGMHRGREPGAREHFLHFFQVHGIIEPVPPVGDHLPPAKSALPDLGDPFCRLPDP